MKKIPLGQILKQLGPLLGRLVPPRARALALARLQDHIADRLEQLGAGEGTVEEARQLAGGIREAAEKF